MRAFNWKAIACATVVSDCAFHLCGVTVNVTLHLTVLSAAEGEDCLYLKGQSEGSIQPRKAHPLRPEARVMACRCSFLLGVLNYFLARSPSHATEGLRWLANKLEQFMLAVIEDLSPRQQQQGLVRAVRRRFRMGLKAMKAAILARKISRPTPMQVARSRTIIRTKTNADADAPLSGDEQTTITRTRDK